MSSEPRESDFIRKLEVIQMESVYFQEAFFFMFVNNYLRISTNKINNGPLVFSYQLVCIFFCWYTLLTFVTFLHNEQTLFSKANTTYNRNNTYSTYFINTTYTTQCNKNNITNNTKHHHNANIAITPQ